MEKKKILLIFDAEDSFWFRRIIGRTVGRRQQIPSEQAKIRRTLNKRFLIEIIILLRWKDW